jgi:hypothetical protein
MKQLSLYLIIILLTILLYSLPIATTIPSLTLFHLLILTIIATTLAILIVLLLLFYLTNTSNAASLAFLPDEPDHRCKG